MKYETIRDHSRRYLRRGADEIFSPSADSGKYLWTFTDVCFASCKSGEE